jgi:hypothetical protein
LFEGAVGGLEIDTEAGNRGVESMGSAKQAD